MLLKDRLQNSYGPLFFKYRGEQFILYILVILVEFNDYANKHPHFYYQFFCFAVCILGMLIRIYTIAYIAPNTSGRNRTGQVADSLNTTGMYSMMRNPLYLANYCILLGISLLTANIEVVIFNSILFLALYLPIILAEEDFLLQKFGDKYAEYAAKTNCLIPAFKNFVKPERNFNFITILRREHDTVLTTVLGFLGAVVFINAAQMKAFYLQTSWLYMLLFVLVCWSILKRLKLSGKLSAD